MRIAGLAVVGVGLAAALSACARGPKSPGDGAPMDGPMSDLTKELMRQLEPSWRSGGLDVATQGVREVREGDQLRGRYDGTRLLEAADTHAYGTPRIIGDGDVADDGRATFNEVREVVRSFDVNGDGSFQRAEQGSFEQAVGVRWIPA